MELSRRIRERREVLNMSQEELASKLGYKDRSTIAKIEQGINDITQSKITAFAEALETTPKYLMGWTNDPYDYDKDPELRIGSIPSDIFNQLSDTHGCDLSAIWTAFWDMESEKLNEVMNKKPATNEGDGLTDDERTLIQLFRQMTADQQKTYLAALEAGLKAQGLM